MLKVGLRTPGGQTISDDGINQVLINPDLMKEKLPEYRAGVAAQDKLAARFAHEESSYIAKRVQRAAMENGQDLLIDSIGVSFDRTLFVSGPAGYKMTGFYATVDPDIAVQRSNARYLKTGRDVPEDFIRSRHATVAQVFPEAVRTMDSVMLFDTTDGARLVAFCADADARGATVVLVNETPPSQVWPYPDDVLGFPWAIDNVAGRAPESLTQAQARDLVAALVGGPTDDAMPDALYAALDAAGLLRDGDGVPVEPNLEAVSGPDGLLGDVHHDINVLCETCEHYQGNSRCEAFRGEILRAIVAGLHDHRRQYPGDHGLRYTPTPGTAAHLGL